MCIRDSLIFGVEFVVVCEIILCSDEVGGNHFFCNRFLYVIHMCIFYTLILLICQVIACSQETSEPVTYLQCDDCHEMHLCISKNVSIGQVLQ